MYSNELWMVLEGRGKMLTGTEIPHPDPYGSKQEVDVYVGYEDGIFRYGQVYFFAVRAFHGKWSAMSNIVQAALPHPHVETEGGREGEEDSLGNVLMHTGLSPEEWIGIIVACVLFVLLMLSLALFCCLRRRSPSKKPLFQGIQCKFTYQIEKS